MAPISTQEIRSRDNPLNRSPEVARGLLAFCIPDYRISQYIASHSETYGTSTEILVKGSVSCDTYQRIYCRDLVNDGGRDTSALARLHHQVRADRDAGYEWMATHDEDWRRAVDVQAAMWHGGRTRPVGPPDLLTAAVAERERVTVLRYDGDYELIAQVTGQPVQWAVPRGTVP